MADPATLDEYNKKFEKNTKTFGHGLEVGMTVPCTFCAEPDFITYRIITMAKDIGTGDHTCKHCHRSCRILIEYPTESSTTFRIVVTGGDPPAPYLEKMLERRR